MDSFTTLTGAAAPLMRANIDTDTIIRIDRMTGATPQQMAPYVFEALRICMDGSTDPDFVLNREPFRDAPILIAGENFGCGSSREGAVWALKYSGIRCIIAPSFGDIFRNNCFQNGVLPVTLSHAQVTALARDCGGGNARITVDLRQQTVTSPHGEVMRFAIEGIRREGLLQGLDEIEATLTRQDAIAAWQEHDRIARPWVWHPAEEIEA